MIRPGGDSAAYAVQVICQGASFGEVQLHGAVYAAVGLADRDQNRVPLFGDTYPPVLLRRRGRHRRDQQG